MMDKKLQTRIERARQRAIDQMTIARYVTRRHSNDEVIQALHREHLPGDMIPLATIDGRVYAISHDSSDVMVGDLTDYGTFYWSRA